MAGISTLIAIQSTALHLTHTRGIVFVIASGRAVDLLFRGSSMEAAAASCAQHMFRRSSMTHATAVEMHFVFLSQAP